MEFNILELLKNNYPLNMHFDITIHAEITQEITCKQYYVCLITV